MSIFDPQFSFDIISSKMFLAKLEEEYKDFDNNHTSARFAINCALNSWHLVDWTYFEYYKNKSKFKDFEEYRGHLLQLCPELKYMRLISNGSKHCILRNAANKEKTIHHKGDFSSDFSRHDFDVDRFEILLDNGCKIEFEDLLLQTITFWRRYVEDCELRSQL